MAQNMQNIIYSNILVVKLINKFIFLKQVLTPKKIYNLLLKEIQSALGNSRLFYYPNKLTIDIGNICNLRCPLCPTGSGDEGASKGMMKTEVFKKVINELGSYLTKLELHNWGEPLLHKDLIGMILYAKGKNIPVSISTNLMLLDQSMAEALISTHIDKIFISCDGASPETYVKYRVGGDFYKILYNIHLLLEAKRKLNNRYTRLILLFHVFRHNEHEIEKIRKLTKELRIELRINKMRTDMGKEIFEKVENSIERDKDWIPENPKYSAFDIDRKEKKIQMRCKQLWTTSVINWDGSVLPCCAVYGEQYAFGNVSKEPFVLVWNNQNYRLARKEVLNKIKESPTICHICKENGFLHF
jgi:radical SAM protein with 4Fe4S-binding SPASM domain